MPSLSTRRQLGIYHLSVACVTHVPTKESTTVLLSSIVSSSNSESSLMMPASSDVSCSSSGSSLMPELLKRWIQPPNDRNYYGSVSKDAPDWVQSLHYYYNTSYYKNNTYDYLLPSRAAKRQRVGVQDIRCLMKSQIDMGDSMREREDGGMLVGDA